MRYAAAAVLAALSSVALADPADTPKPGGGIVNRQTGAETFPYRGVPLDSVRPGVALAPAPVVASNPPKAVACRPTGPLLRVVCDDGR
jgi:hypothetical protein